MSKRCLNKKFDISGTAPKILLSRDKAEKMCKKKLRQTKKINSNLCQTVLVKNTLKYVRSCKHFILASEPPQEYQPFHKKSCKDISSDDIDNILDELSFSRQLSKCKTQLNWNDSKCRRQNAFDINEDISNVLSIEMLEYQSDEEGFLSNGSHLSNSTMDNTSLDLTSIWDLSIH